MGWCVLWRSAGVGRTGAFIVIDSMLERIRHEKTVDVYGHVTCLRAQRNYMVQTEDQYIFVHDAVLEAVQCGTTEIPARNLFTHIQRLSERGLADAATGIEREFRVRRSILIHSLPTHPSPTMGGRSTHLIRHCEAHFTFHATI